MRALWAAGLAVALGGACLRMESVTRTERGALLRSYDREEVFDGGLRGEVRVAWPALNVAITEFDACRVQTVNAYLEQDITENTVPSTGAALSTGISLVLGAGVGLLASFLVSGAPDTDVIDAQGRFGPAPRATVQALSLVAAGVGLPALVVGLLGLAQSGEEVRERTVEQVVAQRETPCRGRGLSGELVLEGPRGVAGRVALDAGVAAVLPQALKGPVERLALEAREVELDDTSVRTLAAYSACVQAEAQPVGALEALGEGALLTRLERLAACRDVRPDMPVELLAALEDELSRRRQAGVAGAFGPAVRSLEEAVAAYAPRLKLQEGSPDLARLEAPEALEGQAVLLRGVVAEGVSANIGVLKLGEVQVYLFLPPRAVGGSFGNGTRVEGVAIVAGRQTVGERHLPLLRAVYLRPAF